MNTVLYMSLTANGYISQTDEIHPIPKEILADFTQHVEKAGTLINGRRTYEQVRDTIAQGSFSNIEVIIVSHQKLTGEGISIAKSPQEALQYLEQEGFKTALVGGGAQLDSSFLSEGLVDEIYLNVNPIIANRGISLDIDEGMEANLELINTTNLSNNIIQLKYRIN